MAYQRKGRAELKHTLIEATVSAPPVTVAGMTWFGHPVDTWLKVVSLLWLVLQSGIALYKLWKSKEGE